MADQHTPPGADEPEPACAAPGPHFPSITTHTVSDTPISSEERFRSVIDTALDAIIATDGEQRIIIYNAAAELMFGYPAAEAMGQPLSLLIPQRFATSHNNHIQVFGQSSQVGQSGALRKSVIGRRASGEEFPCEVSISTVVSGQATMYNAIIRDVSGRQRAEQALRKSEALLSEAQQIARLGHWEWTAPGLDMFCSPEVLRIFGLPPETLTVPLHTLIALVDPEDGPWVRALEEQLLASHADLDYEYRIRLPDGSRRWIHQQARVTYADDGQPQRMLGTFQDITAQKEVELALRQRSVELDQANQQLRQIAEHIQEVFWLFDVAEQRLIYVSPAYETIWGESRDLLYADPRRHLSLVHPADLPIVLAAREREYRAEATSFEYRIQHPDGSLRWVWERSFPILHPDGRLARTVGVATDITASKHAEQAAHNRTLLLETVIGLSKNITAITNLDACARAIHRSITAGFGFDRAGIFLYDRADSTLHGLYGTDRAGKLMDIHGRILRLSEIEPWQHALGSPNGLHVTEDFQATYNPPADNEMYGVGQHITLAAWAGEEPVAMIAVDNLPSQRPIAEAELEALRLFAGYVGLALANARMYAERQ